MALLLFALGLRVVDVIVATFGWHPGHLYLWLQPVGTSIVFCIILADGNGFVDAEGNYSSPVLWTGAT